MSCLPSSVPQNPLLFGSSVVKSEFHQCLFRHPALVPNWFKDQFNCGCYNPGDLLLASGFWYVIDGFALLNLFHPRSYKFKLQSYGLARALGESEIWYCSDYVLDLVEPEYTFEEFMVTALNSGIVEYYEGIQDEYDTSYFHEVLRATQPVLKKFSVLIIGSDEVFKSFAAEHGVELSLPCIDQHRVYYNIELEYEGLDGHPFLQDIYRLHDVFDIWEIVNSQEMNPSDDEL